MPTIPNSGRDPFYEVYCRRFLDEELPILCPEINNENLVLHMLEMLDGWGDETRTFEGHAREALDYYRSFSSDDKKVVKTCPQVYDKNLFFDITTEFGKSHEVDPMHPDGKQLRVRYEGYVRNGTFATNVDPTLGTRHRTICTHN